jgi:hypothetical protein
MTKEKKSDDDISIATESTISTARTETERRRERLRRLRLVSRSRSDDSSVLSSSSNESNFPLSPRNIMTVRTVGESLDGGRLVELRKKERRLRLKLLSDHFDSKGSSSDEGSSSSNHQSVRFDSVTIRQYPVIPGDNPSVSEGPPLTMDWKSSNKFSTNVDKFEEVRKGHRRHSSQMRMPSSMRVIFLIEQEYSIRDIAIATKEAAIIRTQRLQTVASLNRPFTEERVSAIRRWMGKHPFRQRGRHSEEIFCH